MKHDPKKPISQVFVPGRYEATVLRPPHLAAEEILEINGTRKERLARGDLQIKEVKTLADKSDIIGRITNGEGGVFVAFEDEVFGFAVGDHGQLQALDQAIVERGHLWWRMHKVAKDGLRLCIKGTWLSLSVALAFEVMKYLYEPDNSQVFTLDAVRICVRLIQTLTILIWGTTGWVLWFEHRIGKEILARLGLGGEVKPKPAITTEF